MRQLKIVKAPDPILTQKCIQVERITPGLRALALDMLRVMRTHDGIGLASPQVGKILRLFVVDIEWSRKKSAPKGYAFFNPVLSTSGPTVLFDEGCLSMPGVRIPVERPAYVQVEALGLDGRFFKLDAEGLLSRVIQHEYDHLDGVLIA